MGFRVINGKMYPVGYFPENTIQSKKETLLRKKNETSFSDILNKELNPNESFVISKHAASRLKVRNISFDKEDMNKINKAINKAKEKGCKESVIVYKNTALLANIKNRTIITACDTNKEEENIFTNVDSVVIL